MKWPNILVVSISLVNLFSCAVAKGGSSEQLCRENIRVRAILTEVPTLATKADIERWLVSHDFVSSFVSAGAQAERTFTGTSEPSATALPRFTTGIETREAESGYFGVHITLESEKGSLVDRGCAVRLWIGKQDQLLRIEVEPRWTGP